MKKQSSKLTKYQEFKMKTRTWFPVMRNNWIIKFSEYQGNILLLFVSSITGQTIVRYFTNEDDACLYINYILLQDASDEIPC
jgi:hypothetical protein